MSAPLTNPTGEKAVLGAALRDREGFHAVRDLLQPAAFANKLFGRVFAEIGSAYDSGHNPTIQYLVAKLGEEIDGVEIDSTLAVLMKNAADVGGALHDLASDLAELSARRRLLEIADGLKAGATSGKKISSDLSQEAEAALLEAGQAAAPRRPRRLSDIAKSVGSITAQPERAPLRFDTGLPSLDEIMGEILGGDLVTILASTGDGKTSLATQIGMHISRKKPVLMVQLEMGADQIAARELAAASGITVAELHRGQLRLDEIQQLQDAHRALDLYGFHILESEKITLREIRGHALAMKRTIGLGAVIIDQLDKLRTEKPHRDRFERIAELTRDSKALAKELGVPIIMLAQRTRGSQRRDDSTPHVTDADSPMVERDSDILIAPWREETWLRANRPNGKRGGESMDEWAGKVARAKGWAKIVCLKRRRGEAYQEREFKWSGHLTRFEESF